jgi:hypothetical protein
MRPSHQRLRTHDPARYEVELGLMAFHNWPAAIAESSSPSSDSARSVARLSSSVKRCSRAPAELRAMPKASRRPPQLLWALRPACKAERERNVDQAPAIHRRPHDCGERFDPAFQARFVVRILDPGEACLVYAIDFGLAAGEAKSIGDA